MFKIYLIIANYEIAIFCHCERSADWRRVRQSQVSTIDCGACSERSEESRSSNLVSDFLKFDRFASA
ncbi:MAG: hypothetical protein Q8N37_04865 [bacterium]|nr:hypothetical protein [bacterium]